MEQFSVTPTPANNNNNNINEEIEHDSLPPAVDYSGVSPSARYQFRALGRGALSDNKIHAAYYLDGFGDSSNRLFCVRWFGNTYPNKALHENITAAERDTLDTKQTETFTSAVWPSTDPKIVFPAPQNTTAANGLLDDIPVRYANKIFYDGVPSKASNEYSAQKYIAVQDGDSLDTKISEVVLKWEYDFGYDSDPSRPFGGVYYETVDTTNSRSS
ncbi:hypothetical protein BG000_011771 [Podila horticola]|nr:hypothetical protein BG000_011771 [Podila horticola]